MTREFEAMRPIVQAFLSSQCIRPSGNSSQAWGATSAMGLFQPQLPEIVRTAAVREKINDVRLGGRPGRQDIVGTVGRQLLDLRTIRVHYVDVVVGPAGVVL